MGNFRDANSEERKILEEINYEDRNACVCGCGSVDCWNVGECRTEQPYWTWPAAGATSGSKFLASDFLLESGALCF
jgi:hypothetical protein